MPHIHLKSLECVAYPVKIGKLEFAFEAQDIFDCKRSIIICKDNESFILTKIVKEDSVLIKYNNSLKVQFISNVKNAIMSYAKLSNSVILSHNLNNTKQPKNISTYFKNIDWVLESDLLNNTKKLIVEIGFGSGRHILDMAKIRRDCIFIGLEIYRPAIEQVLNQINILGLENLFIMNVDCRILFDILPSNILDEIYLHFPVPWDKNQNRRVISKEFFIQIKRLLKCGGYFELRTDSKEYYCYALEIYPHNDFEIGIKINETKSIISKYEQRWLRQNKDIYNVVFTNLQNQNEVKNIQKIFIKPLIMQKILESKNLKYNNGVVFYHIKNIYKFQRGYVLFVIFGAYHTPSSAYLIIQNGCEVEILGDIIHTNSNKQSLELLQEHYGEN